MLLSEEKHLFDFRAVGGLVCFLILMQLSSVYICIALVSMVVSLI